MSRPAVIEDFRHGTLVCPHCAECLDAATHVFGNGRKANPPQPGAITVCLHCTHVCQFVLDGLLFRLVPFDTSSLDPDTRREIELIQVAARRTKVQR
jgi:hypothetical protein